MIVAGWADGYRNNSFRTVEALRDAGVPHRLLAGPWVHADPTTAYPGPRIDLDRGDGRVVGPLAARPRRDTAPRRRRRVRADLHPAGGRSWTSTRAAGSGTTGPRRTVSRQTRALAGPRSLAVDPDVGTAAWIDCAGHLPWGLSVDQREDDARSLVWEWAGDAEQVILGQPRVRLRLSVDAPAASVSVKLCDVFPDGTSALITRGQPRPRLPRRRARAGRAVARWSRARSTTSRWCSTPAPTSSPRVSGCDSRSPAPTGRTPIAPPAPVTLTVHDGSLELPLRTGGGAAASAVHPGCGVVLGGPG